jgi:hypothetical protein
MKAKTGESCSPYAINIKISETGNWGHGQDGYVGDEEGPEDITEDGRDRRLITEINPGNRHDQASGIITPD